MDNFVKVLISNYQNIPSVIVGWEAAPSAEEVREELPEEEVTDEQLQELLDGEPVEVGGGIYAVLSVGIINNIPYE